jgi:hypothetical protein
MSRIDLPEFVEELLEATIDLPGALLADLKRAAVEPEGRRVATLRKAFETPDAELDSVADEVSHG